MALELTVEGEGACRTGLSRVVPGINRRGSKERVKRGLSRRPRNYLSGTRERVGRYWLRRPRNYLLGAKERVGRDWLRWTRNYPSGAKSVSDGAGCVDPGNIRRGTGLVATVGGGGFAVCGSLAEGEAPSSPEVTVGADGDTVDWNAPRSVTYGRRGGI